MVHPSKNKGNRWERRIVNFCLESGVEAERAYGSNGEALGHHTEVDVLIDGRWRVQAKARKSIADYVQPSEHVDCVALKQNRGEELVVLRLADFVELVKASEVAKFYALQSAKLRSEGTTDDQV